MNIKRNIIFALESRKKNGVPVIENVPIRMRVIFASWKSPVCVTPEAQVPLTLESKFRMTPIKS